MKLQKIALHGAVYGKNFGDILIQKILLDNIEQSNLFETYFPLGINRFTKTLNKKPLQIFSFKRPKAIIFGPGGYLGEPKYKSLRWVARFIFYHGFAILYSIIFRIPIYVFGVGAGPIKNPFVRMFVYLLIMRSKVVFVRDEFSQSFLTKLVSNKKEIIATCDVAYSLGHNIENPNLSNNLDSVGLHVPVADRIGMPKEFLEDIILWVTENPNTKFYLLHDGPMQKIHLKLEKLLKLTNFTEISYESHSKLLQDISKLDMVLSTKLHVPICAYAMGVKAISAHTHPKNIRFFKQIGNSNYTIDLKDYKSGWIMNYSKKALDNKDYFFKRHGLINDAQESLQKLLELLKKQGN